MTSTKNEYDARSEALSLLTDLASSEDAALSDRLHAAELILEHT